MIKIAARQNCRAFLRRISTGNGHARPHAARNSHVVVHSLLCDAGSAYRNRPTGGLLLIASHRSVQQTSAIDRRRRNPHSV